VEHNDAVVVSGLKVRRGGRVILDGIEVRIPRGQVTGLIGPSGCGKTTLLKQIAGFEDPTSGSIAIEGKPMLGVPPGRRPTSMVFQRLALFPHMTVAENIGFGLALRREPKDYVVKDDDILHILSNV